MNDHNLDDLIIDNIEPKNTKTKSILTVMALLIIVLIVAIILTKIILKKPKDQLVLETDNTELISPDLTLEPTKSEDKKIKKTDNLSLIKGKQPSSVEIKKPLEVEDNKKKISEKKDLISKEKNETMLKSSKKPEEKRIKKELSKEEHKIEKNSKNIAKNVHSKEKPYYIQVGSFTKTPSSRFLSIIKNSGFNYTITPIKNGTKKLLIGPYPDIQSVNVALIRAKDRINKSAFVIKK